jgi:DtxR family Mn-dependent transcriptional regulator
MGSATKSLRASRPRLSEAQEDYLKQIHLLGGGEGVVATQVLADRLRVRPASVTGMVRRLADLGLVAHEKYRGVQLTPPGKLVALEMLRHHRLLETFLARTLGFGWEEVHDEAERLEHFISEAFEERIDEVMGFPTHDPHGDPIPTAELTMPAERRYVRLSDVPPDRTIVVVRVRAQDRDTLNLLTRLGLTLESRVHVVDRSKRGVHIWVDGEGLLVPRAVADHVWVEDRENV